jgi:hemolysin III
MTQRQQSIEEEVANSIIHGLALLSALVASPFLISKSQQHGDAAIIGAVIFSVTMVVLYLTSTLYHALPNGRAKQVLLKFDHGSIYFFIAGSYTPFALSAPNELCYWILFCVVWTLAAAGAMLKAFNKLNHPWLSTGLYIIMGWIVLIAALPLIKNLPPFGIVLLVAGGLAYTGGVLFFIFDSKFKYAHTIWHSFVVAGSCCHFFAVLNYAT